MESTSLPFFTTDAAVSSQELSIARIKTSSVVDFSMGAIGVTYGPGLVGALLVGVAEAKAIAFEQDPAYNDFATIIFRIFFFHYNISPIIYIILNF